VERNDVRCPDEAAAARMIERIERARKDGDSVGGVVRAVARGVPAGWGEPVFDKLEADLAKAMMSIPAVKGVESGDGFAGTRLTGSEHNDLFLPPGRRRDRHAHEPLRRDPGRISNGEPITLRIAFKPTATIMRPQETVDPDGNPATLEPKGRHDPCVPAAGGADRRGDGRARARGSRAPPGGAERGGGLVARARSRGIARGARGRARSAPGARGCQTMPLRCAHGSGLRSAPRRAGLRSGRWACRSSARSPDRRGHRARGVAGVTGLTGIAGLGPAFHVPPAAIVGRDGARAVAVARLLSGRVVVVDDVCPHDGGRISDGFVDASASCARARLGARGGGGRLRARRSASCENKSNC